MMDEMDGIEFLKKLARNEKYNKIPFIFLTAKNDIQSNIEGLSLGAIDYMKKP
jgi:DNA-binding response OmpR family regulator